MMHRRDNEMSVFVSDFFFQLFAVDSGNLTRIIGSYCGRYVDPSWIVSENNKLLIVFRSNSRFNDIGFNITYQEGECKYSIQRITP